MNVPAWLERAAPGDLGILLSKSASPRKSGLFVRHLCRLRPEAFPDPRSLAALDAADRYEAGEIDEAALRAAMQAAARAAEETAACLQALQSRQASSYGPAFAAMTAANLACEAAAHGCSGRVMPYLMRVVGASTCPRSTSRKRAARAIRLLFLEHFGDVRRPVAFEPSWRTGPVLAIAACIYAEKAFDDMVVLGDALEDAGCSDADLLGHCRGGGEHARGCWALDLILSKDR